MPLTHGCRRPPPDMPDPGIDPTTLRLRDLRLARLGECVCAPFRLHTVADDPRTPAQHHTLHLPRRRQGTIWRPLSQRAPRTTRTLTLPLPSLHAHQLSCARPCPCPTIVLTPVLISLLVAHVRSSWLNSGRPQSRWSKTAIPMPCLPSVGMRLWCTPPPLELRPALKRESQTRAATVAGGFPWYL